jgi:hypothetical protein
MTWSLLVLLVPIALMVGLFRYLGHDEPSVVDPGAAYAAARSANEFAVLEPALPGGWKVQTALFQRQPTGGVLRIGVLSPGGGAMQLVETATPAASYVPTELGQQARGQGTADVGGRPWTWYAGGREQERALVFTDSGRTVIVYGRASDGDLRTLASSLR